LLARVLPALVACLALVTASQASFAPALAAVACLGSALVSWRVPMDRATQRLALLVVVILVVAGIRGSAMPLRGPGLGAVGYGFALAPVLLVAARAWIDRPEGTTRIDAALSLASLLATGAARSGRAYLACVVLFFCALAIQQRSRNPDRLPLAAVSPRTRWLALALASTAFASSVLLAFGAQVANGRILERFEHAFETSYEASVGFSDSVRLGGLAPLLRSDVVVLRVTGPPIERLRGVVLDEYGGGRWTKADVEAPQRTLVPRFRPDGADVILVHPVEPNRDYLFVPLEARDVATSEGEILVDSMGGARSVSSGTPPDVWFRTGPRDAIRVAAPRTADLLMPHKLRAPLTAIAKEWAKNARTPEEALAALEAHLLEGYAYSLDRQPQSALDPILLFLTVSRRGYCAHFASAFVLLARSLGIPARIVLGYRVGERNPYGSHYVVREKNAHAWAEAFVRAGRDGAWTTYDPTPMTELGQDLPHDERGLGAVVEAMAVAWERIEVWLTRRSVFEYAGAAIFGVVVFAAQRWWRARRERRAVRGDGLEFDPPSPAFARFEAGLAERGLGRRTGETLERWADRLGSADLRDTLLGYARARYGGEHVDGLEDALARAARDPGLSLTPRST
jgi:transglutaminase-like putative cysteine protease